jgi:hypothetical protein
MTIEWRKLYRMVRINGQEFANLRGTREDGKVLDVYLSGMGWNDTLEMLKSLVYAMDNTPRDDDGTPTA